MTSALASAREPNICTQEQNGDWAKALKRWETQSVEDLDTASRMRQDLEEKLAALKESSKSWAVACGSFFYELIAITLASEFLWTAEATGREHLRQAAIWCSLIDKRYIDSEACLLISGLNDLKSSSGVDSPHPEDLLLRCKGAAPVASERVWADLCEELRSARTDLQGAKVRDEISRSQETTLARGVHIGQQKFEQCLGKSDSRVHECMEGTHWYLENVILHHYKSRERTLRTLGDLFRACEILEGVRGELPGDRQLGNDSCTRDKLAHYVDETKGECNDRRCRQAVKVIARTHIDSFDQQLPVDSKGRVSEIDTEMRRRRLKIVAGTMWGLTALSFGGSVFLAVQVFDSSGQYYRRVHDSAGKLGFPELGNDPCSSSYQEKSAEHRSECSRYDTLKTATYAGVGSAAALFVASLIATASLKRIQRRERGRQGGIVVAPSFFGRSIGISGRF